MNELNANNEKKVIEDIGKQLDSLTNQNWLFLSYIRKNVPIKEAYKLAGYKSEVPSAPYMLMKRLRVKAELLTDLEDFNRLKYKAELIKLLSLPLSDTKKDVTISEKLRILKLFKGSLPDMQETPKHQFTQIVINRYGTKQADIAEIRGRGNVLDATLADTTD